MMLLMTAGNRCFSHLGRVLKQLLQRHFILEGKCIFFLIVGLFCCMNTRQTMLKVKSWPRNKKPSKCCNRHTMHIFSNHLVYNKKRTVFFECMSCRQTNQETGSNTGFCIPNFKDSIKEDWPECLWLLKRFIFLSCACAFASGNEVQGESCFLENLMTKTLVQREEDGALHKSSEIYRKENHKYTKKEKTNYFLCLHFLSQCMFCFLLQMSAEF